MPKLKPPENETNEERFRRIAPRRAMEIIRKIRVLRHCSNITVYRYTPEQVQKLFDPLEEELRRARDSFNHEEKMPEIQL